MWQYPQGEQIGGWWRWAGSGEMRREKDFALGNGHMMQMMFCSVVHLETCMVLLTNITLIYSIEKYKGTESNRKINVIKQKSNIALL